MPADCDLVLPCKDEGPALRALLPTVPDVFTVIVVDNGSTDDTAAVARSLGARVVAEARPGYGAAVHAGVAAATADMVAVMDGDGSFAAADLVQLLDEVRTGRSDLATGRRRAGLPVHDIAPMRVCRREALLALDVRDRRFGYPVELLQKAQQDGWRITETDVAYHPRAEGTRSKVSGSVRGSVRAARDFARVLS